MTVTSQTIYTSHTGNGVTTVFAFAFELPSAADLLVQVDGVTNTLTTDYSVTGFNNPAGGSVTFVSAPSNGAEVVLRRDTVLQRTTDYQTNGDFLAPTVNDDFDRLWFALQERNADVNRTLRAPEYVDLDEIPSASSRANKYLGFDSDGQPVALAPDDGTASSLAATLASDEGAAAIGFESTANIAATDVQAAIEEVDTEVRAANATTSGNVAAIELRVTALEAGASSGIIAKATKADLDADLAHVADTLAYVTEDGTAANNGFYRKTGGSGAGSWVKSTADQVSLVTNIAAALARDFANALPLYGEAVVAVKIATDRWLVRTPVVDGAPHDYTEWEMHDMGAYMSLTYAYSLHSIRASIGGVMNRFMEQHPTDGNVSTTEFAIYAGKTVDAFNDTYYKFYGFGHGFLNYSSFTITLDGGGTNYRAYPVGTVIRGATVTFDGSYVPKTADGTTIGTVGVAHIFTSAGLNVAHQHVISTAGISAQNSYSAMMPLTGINRAKGLGTAAITVGAADGSQVGNWGAITTLTGYHSDRPNNLMELILPNGHPGNPPGDWSEATTSRTFVLDLSSKIRKFYVNWRSGSSPVSFSGTYNFATTYRVRVGTAV